MQQFNPLINCLRKDAFNSFVMVLKDSLQAYLKKNTEQEITLLGLIILIESALNKAEAHKAIRVRIKAKLEENPYPYKRWQTLRKNVNVNRSAQLMDRAIAKASMPTYGKTFSDIDDKSLQNQLLKNVMTRKSYSTEGTYIKAA